MIWNYELSEIIKGYSETEEQFCCVMCSQKYEKGRIYSENQSMYDAEGAVRQHIRNVHGNVASYLLQQEAALTGLSDVQNQLLTCLLNGKTDREIGRELGIAQSTVRNHRFKLREKEKQAKLFLALMNSISIETKSSIEKSDTGNIEELHAAATMVDDRYNISDQERKKTIQTYMGENGVLKQFPSREKKKIIVLGEILRNFEAGTDYSEKEVNKILKRVYEADYPTIRRALIEYGFMERTLDCLVYRIK